jgi:glutamyl-tRNA reductase
MRLLFCGIKFMASSKIFACGMSYKTASVAVREKVALREASLEEKLRGFMSQGGLAELVCLSTCNRFELYGVAGSNPIDPTAFFEWVGGQEINFAQHGYVLHGDDAIDHLFRVASGLESMVLGETEITSQVKVSYERALAAGRTAKVLNKVFQTALRTAKAVRTETAIGSGITSIGGVCALQASEVFASGLENKNVLVIGAGHMAVTCVRHLHKRGIARLTVMNRSLENARKVAVEFGGRAWPMDLFQRALGEADIIISSTSSPELIVQAADVELAMKSRADRPLFLIDIAVPRDIDAGVENVANVHLYDIDFLEKTAERGVGVRKSDLHNCTKLIDEKKAELRTTFRNAELAKKRSERSNKPTPETNNENQENTGHHNDGRSGGVKYSYA